MKQLNLASCSNWNINQVYTSFMKGVAIARFTVGFLTCPFVFYRVLTLAHRVFSLDIAESFSINTMFSRSVFFINNKNIIKDTIKLRGTSIFTRIIYNFKKSPQGLVTFLIVEALKVSLLYLNIILHSSKTIFKNGLNKEFLRENVEHIKNSFSFKKLEKDVKYECIFGPIFEELIFRLGLQNILWAGQKLAIRCVSSALLNTRVVAWITSPAARVLAVHSLFSAVHILNGNGFSQPLKIFLWSRLSYVYETTGNILVPIALHVIDNSLCSLKERVKQD